MQNILLTIFKLIICGNNNILDVLGQVNYIIIINYISFYLFIRKFMNTQMAHICELCISISAFLNHRSNNIKIAGQNVYLLYLRHVSMKFSGIMFPVIPEQFCMIPWFSYNYFILIFLLCKPYYICYTCVGIAAAYLHIYVFFKLDCEHL